MTVTLELKPEIEKTLRERALAKGKNLDGYLIEIIEKDAGGIRSLDEILAPFRREVEESGITDDEFDEFVEDIRDDMHQKNLRQN